MRFITWTLIALAATTGMAVGATADRIQAGVSTAQINQIARSLVWVKYTAENEFKKSTKLRAQGIVLNKQGVVMVTSDLFPDALPLS
jgi:hypothetical protein